MKNELKKLDELLIEKRPEYYSKLNNPLSIEEITALELKYEFVLPETVKDLYLWKNGQTKEGHKVLVNGCLFVPLEDALEINKEFTKKIGGEFFLENQWSPNWLPIFRDGGGSCICYDMEGVFTGQKDQLVQYLNGYDERQVIAPNLESFIKQVNEYYQEILDTESEIYFDISERIIEWKQVFYVDEPIE